MPKVDVVSVAGKKVGTRDLAPQVFEAKVSVPLNGRAAAWCTAPGPAITRCASTRR